MAAEKEVTVTTEMTVGHVVPGMPAVYGTPTMILHVGDGIGIGNRQIVAGGICQRRNDG